MKYNSESIDFKNKYHQKKSQKEKSSKGWNSTEW